MDIVNAVALKSFNFEGLIRKPSSPPFPVERHRFNALKAKGLVKEALPLGNPLAPVGILQSASPAGQVSLKTIAEKSGNGGRRSGKQGKKASESLS